MRGKKEDGETRKSRRGDVVVVIELKFESSKERVP